jgi:hypothetical protein
MCIYIYTYIGNWIILDISHNLRIRRFFCYVYTIAIFKVNIIIAGNEIISVRAKNQNNGLNDEISNIQKSYIEFLANSVDLVKGQIGIYVYMCIYMCM